MIRGDRRTLVIGGAVLALVACSAALAFHLMGASKSEGPGIAKVLRHGAGGSADDEEARAVERTFDDYRVVTQRNVFRPLVAPPQESVKLAVPVGIPSPTGSGSSPAASSGSPPQPDPTADLAMTGVVENKAGLRVLIRNVKTGAAVYAKAGDEAFGLRVTGIEAKRATLTRGDRAYTLQMGTKQVPTGVSSSAPSATLPSGGRPSSSQGASEGDRRGPPFGGFGGRSSPDEMLRRLEENRSRMTPEQYERARQFIEMRRQGDSGGRGR